MFNADNKFCAMGRVWFTVAVTVYEEKNVPTQGAVVAAITALAATAIYLPGVLMVPAFVAMGVTSVKGHSRSGVYADGKMLVAKGTVVDGGVLALVLHNADATAPADPPEPQAAADAAAPAAAAAAPAAAAAAPAAAAAAPAAATPAAAADPAPQSAGAASAGSEVHTAAGGVAPSLE